MYRLIPIEYMKEYCRKINILMGIIDRGGGSKNHVIRNAGLRWDTNGGIYVDDLVEEKYLEYTELRGDRCWVAITDKGRLLVKQWQDFEKNFV